MQEGKKSQRAMVENRTLGDTVFPKRHLFLDTDNLVEWDLNVVQRCHKAEKVPVTGLEPGEPGAWDGRVTVAYGSTLVEDGLFRRWYGCMALSRGYKEDADHWMTAYAESDDGIHWRKPDLKLTGQKRWPGNNLLKLPCCPMTIVRPLPGADYKYLGLILQKAPLEPDVSDTGDIEYNGGGMYLFGSDDGFRWRQITKNPIIQHGDWAVLHVDRFKQRYLLYQKMGTCHGLTPRRSALVIESKDGIHWEGYDGLRQWQETFAPDDYDDLIAAQRGCKIGELYGYATLQVDRLYLVAENFFTVGLPLHHKQHQNPNGPSHLRMAFSHDGKIWRYPRGRPSFLEVGNEGDFDAGFLAPSSEIVEHEDNHLLYYSGARYLHGWMISPDFQMRPDIPLEAQRNSHQFRGLARIKRDRFAGLASGWKGRFDAEVGPVQGTELTINAYCPHGVVRVAIAEQIVPLHLSPRKGESLPGFSFDDCVPFTGDSVRAPVRFKNKSLADLPADKRLILRFEMCEAEVFGYEWQP